MPGFNGITVAAPEGSRWDLALELIESGEAAVRLGEVEIRRDVAGPSAGGVIRMTMRVDERAHREQGQASLLRGRRIVDQAASVDPRFARLLDEHGYRWEIVDDYGMGTTLLGEADGRGGDLLWRV